MHANTVDLTKRYPSPVQLWQLIKQMIRQPQYILYIIGRNLSIRRSAAHTVIDVHKHMHSIQYKYAAVGHDYRVRHAVGPLLPAQSCPNLIKKPPYARRAKPQNAVITLITCHVPHHIH